MGTIPYQLFPLGTVVACHSAPDIRSPGSNGFDYRVGGYPRGLILGITDDFYYIVLGVDGNVHEMRSCDCWKLRSEEIDLDILLTHKNERVRQLAKEILDGRSWI